jgi:hypothetical protein
MSETSGSVPGATQADAPNVPNVPTQRRPARIARPSCSG